MEFKQIDTLLKKYGFFGFIVRKKEHQISYDYRSIAYYSIKITVDTIKLKDKKIVIKVKIGNIEIDDEKELIPTLKTVWKMHNRIIYGKKSNQI